jgi:DNA-binding NarL/FixJ family response regulator
MEMLKRLLGIPRRPATNTLSRRERQVLELLAAGDMNKVIAHKLGVSEQTVKNHCSRIYIKLNTTNRAGAIRAWFERQTHKEENNEH